MNQHHDDQDREIGDMIRRAGPRATIPPEDLRAIRETARVAWRKRVPAPRKGRAGALLALAAGLLLVVLAGRSWLAERRTPAPVVPLASIEATSGPVRVVFDWGESDVATVGHTLTVGTRIETSPDGHVSLRTLDGRSIRLDGATVVLLASDTELDLRAGAVYVDSGPSSSARRELAIVTPLGTVTEIGTQFEVRATRDGATVRVRVREGRVLVDRDGAAHAAGRGEELMLAPGREVERASVDPAGSDWDWVVDAAPAIDIEGRSLSAYLEWVGRETGWQVVYADAELARESTTIVLHGSIDGLRPDESVEVVVPGSGLAFAVDRGTLVIRRP